MSPERTLGAAILEGLVVLAAIFAPGAAFAQEIAPLRLTGVDGYVLVGGMWDDHRTDNAGSDQMQATQREEVFVMTHGYVYHPALMQFDFGGGPVFDYGWYDSGGVGTNSGAWLYNLVARVNFLAGKPYQAGLFYEHLNPTQTVGPAEIMLTESEAYGANLMLLPPLPVPMTADVRHTTSSGRSSEQVIDETYDALNVNLSGLSGQWASVSARYSGLRGQSRSGSTGLPIVPSDGSSDEFSVDARVDRSYFTLTSVIHYIDQETTSGAGQFFSTRNGSFNLDLTGHVTEELDAHASYDFRNQEQASPAQSGSPGPEFEQSTRSSAVNGGMTFRRGEALAAWFDLTAAWNDGTDADTTATGANGHVDYTWTLPLGELEVNYQLGLARLDQVAKTPEGQVIGEHVVLVGATQAPLSHPLVVPGSVVVSNLDRTQTYVENLDYLLTVIGYTTYIQRTANSNIESGQEVLADYSYETGGTYAIDTVANAATVTWRIGTMMQVWVRYFDNAPRLVSGTPTFELNPTTTWSYGTSVDMPVPGFGGQWTAGGAASYTDSRQVVSPGTSSAFDLHTQFPLPWRYGAGLFLSVNWGSTRYDLEPSANVDTTGYNARLWAALPGNAQFTLDGTHQVQTGPQMDTTYNYLTARLNWQFRRVSLFGEFLYSLQSQYTSDDRSTAARFGLRRDF